MANVKFSQFTSASPSAALALAGFEVGGDNVSVTAQSLSEVTIPTLANAGEFGFGATILKNWRVGPTLSAGALYYWDYNTTAGQNVWSRADNTTANSQDSKGLLVICRDSIVDGREMIAKGVIRVANPGVTWTDANNGNLVYVGATGLVTLVPPVAGSGETQRFIGYVVDGPNYVIHFDPDYTFITV